MGVSFAFVAYKKDETYSYVKSHVFPGKFCRVVFEAIYSEEGAADFSRINSIP